MSKLVAWEVTNFLSIEHGRCEFDDSGIVFLKGYNDSGKSTMLRALDVLMFNSHPRDQVLFIQDEKDYFRILAQFDDGVVILRDKYLNGQSLYEMYKDNECIYSTKVNGTLTKVTEVPEPIQKYLAVIPELTVRTCYDEQFLVQTGGSQNYKALSSILRVEEYAQASALINTDKNKVQSDITSLETQLKTYEEVLKQGTALTDELVSDLEQRDKKLDDTDITLSELETIGRLGQSVGGIKIQPELPYIDMIQLSELQGIIKNKNTIQSIQVTPEIETVSADNLTELSRLLGVQREINSIIEYPSVPSIDFTQLHDIIGIINIPVEKTEIQPVIPNIDSSRISELEEIIKLGNSIPDLTEIESEISKVDKEIKELVSTLGNDVVICQNCGSIVHK